MTVPKVIDKREAWLDGLSMYAIEHLRNAERREERGLTRTQREREYMATSGLSASAMRALVMSASRCPAFSR